MGSSAQTLLTAQIWTVQAATQNICHAGSNNTAFLSINALCKGQSEGRDLGEKCEQTSSAHLVPKLRSNIW